ncbi:MAG: hypothetical protein JXB62_23565 [Pirellulales bacterium]|nr:hypothetical protein [Pirellulales bacterium]
MTLLELLIAMTIMVMVVGTMGTLARGVQQGYQYAEGHGVATQHARVALDRIAGMVREAMGNETFPGAIVLSREVGPWRFPDTLVVWHPDGAAADPAGVPRYNELVIYCPHPAHPNQLIEITDTRTDALDSNPASWPAEIEAIRTARTSGGPSGTSDGQVVTLTKWLRESSLLDPDTSTLQAFGAVRFETRLLPSADQWDAYDAETDAAQKAQLWEAMPWVQGICGVRTGLRQVWVRMELQLMPGEGSTDGADVRAIPFLGSAALFYELRREDE